MRKAVVLLSGGLDSATTLAIARSKQFLCYALSIDYAQRHKSELVAAHKIGQSMGVQAHQTTSIDLSTLGRSALTDETIAVPTDGVMNGIPVTYVPARNTIMLSLALAWAEVLGCYDIFIGVNAIDYSGYPDCRPDYIEAFEKMMNLATKTAREGNRFTLHTPLMQLSKKEIILLGVELGVDYSLTVSCYQADASGLACGICDACRLRKAGFLAAKLPDPTRYKIF